MSTLLASHISLFDGSTNTTLVETVTLAPMLGRIQDGTYRVHVEKLRRYYTAGDDKGYKAAKALSVAFTPCCALLTRAGDVPWDEKLISTTGLVHLDVDHLDDPEALKGQLAQDASVVFAFISPSGHGVKIGIAATGITGPVDYKHAWNTVVAAFAARYPTVHVNVDDHVKYLNALCYVSDDPACYVNDQAVPVVVPAYVPPPPREKRHVPPLNTSEEYERVSSALDYIPNADADYDTWNMLGMALHSTTEPWAEALWEHWSQQSGKYDAHEQAATWNRFRSDGGRTLGSLFHLAQQHGYTPPKKEVPYMAQALHEYRTGAGTVAEEAADEPQPSEQAPQETPRFQTISARELYAKVLPPQRWIVEEILPAGATLFTGRGKDGKSLLVWNLCLAVCTGGRALGTYGVDQGDVLYLALEDGERRAQQRLKEQMQAMGDGPIPAGLDLVLWDAPRMGEGFESALVTWIEEHPTARLVVVDILEKVRPKRTRNGSVYADDYAALESLQRLAQERNIALVVVHHSNKTKPEDFRDTASGSMGLIAGCDTFWSLHRIAGEPDAALKIIGREVEAQSIAMKFQDGYWTALGDADDYRLSETSKAILAVLHQAREPLTPKQVATRLEKPETTMRSQLTRMQERGEVLNLGNGRYVPSPTPPSTPPPSRESERERDGGRENAQSGATHATHATHATGATGATLGEETALELHVPPQSCTYEGGGATLSLDPEAHLSNGKDRDLLSDRVAGVTGVASVAGDGPRARALMTGEAPFCEGGGVVIAPTLFPCPDCHGVERWDDHGIRRCVVCWPQE